MEKWNELDSTESSGQTRIIAELVRETEAVDKYGQRWLDAANRGFALHRLREARARHNKLVLPVWTYLAELAQYARISLDVALAAFELDTQPVVNRASARRIGEVLAHIGCAPANIDRMLRLSFAEAHGYALTPAYARMFRGEERAIADDATLKELESTYPEDLARELAEIQASITDGR